MRLFRDHHHVDLSTSSVVTIGNFDGLHQGHQALIRKCRGLAQESDEVAVVTFEPAPASWFSPATAPARISRVSGKLELLESAGVDLVWMMRFNDALAGWSPEVFARQVLMQGLNSRQVVVGDDFRFGHQRAGDFPMLEKFGASMGFEVSSLDAVLVNDRRVSSTAVRAALSNGRLGAAKAMLGRSYSLTGHVIEGQKLGRTLGYATANVRPPPGKSVMSGIYAVRSRWGGGAWINGVAHLGTRPVVGDVESLLEVHLFDFDGDLYGQRLETEFVEKIRDVEDMPDLDALTRRMKQDEVRARELLAG